MELRNLAIQQPAWRDGHGPTWELLLLQLLQLFIQPPPLHVLAAKVGCRGSSELESLFKSHAV
jgi:hypothetical protein